MNGIIASGVRNILTEGRAFQFMFLILLWALGYLSYHLGKQGKTWPIRMLEGLESIREGIGRSAEMGRPILVLPGIGSMTSETNAQLMAGLTMFGEVTQRAAEIGVPTHCILTDTAGVAASEAIARQAYKAIDKEELYEPGKFIKWYGSGQFVYAVGAAGHLLLEKPAMVIYMGYFLADVIVSGETGSRVGALQIGSTTDQSATPLLGMVCDSMLFGEEMYAASALITEDKLAIATLAGEDWVKVIMLFLMIFGSIACAAGSKAIWTLMGM